MLAAVAFGAVVPLTQRAGHQVGPFFTAALLYGGACGFAGPAALTARGARFALPRGDMARVVVVAVLGAAIAPTLLAWGLQRVAGTTAALLLNFEALFTVLLARVIWREAFGPRVMLALAAMVGGGAVLIGGARWSSGSTPWGAVAVIVATLAWAAENVLSRPLAERNPLVVVFVKSLIGCSLTAAIGVAIRDRGVFDGWRALALAGCGAVGYGVSLTLYLRSQREIGAARTASIFALAPFVGVLMAWGLGDRALTPSTGLAAALFATGVALHLTEHKHALDPRAE